MLKEAIHHQIESEYIFPVDSENLVIRLRTKKNDIDEVYLRYICKYKLIAGDKKFDKVHMKKYAEDNLFDYYEAVVKYEAISLSYYFELTKKGQIESFGNYKFYKGAPRGDFDTFIYAYLSKKDLYEVPDWFQKSIIYHIFPDRFNRGSNFASQDKFSSWDSKVKWDTFLGGNIKGITEKLDYLEDLGINLIYINPLFKSDSTHKYDTEDYYDIDPDFGTKEELKELVDEVHKRNMRILLDGVFNHTGDDFFAFKDVELNEEKSKYRDWYHIDKFPVKKNITKNAPNYKSFAYYYKMPKLLMESEESIDYFIDVILYWIREFDIDGWRMDVADEVSHKFWKRVRDEVKKEKKDAVIIGEIWYDSRGWLRGEQFDSVMNYLFYYAVLEFLAYDAIDATAFKDKLGFIKAIYRTQAFVNMCNLIGSHDTARFLHNAKERIWKLKLAAALQFTYPGVPYIYYGDEIGMTGGTDPDCRRAMEWDEEKQNKNLHKYYKTLIRLRKEKKALMFGKLAELTDYLDENIFAYVREYKNEKIYIFINKSKKDKEIMLSDDIYDLLEERKYKKMEKYIVKKRTACILERLL